MEDCLHRQNLRRYRDLLQRVTDPEQRKQLHKLIAEEEAKDFPPSATETLLLQRRARESLDGPPSSPPPMHAPLLMQD